MGEFLTVGAADAVAEGAATAFDVEGTQIGVARVGGTLYAFSDICTHQGCNLTSGGDLEGTEITRFVYRSGEERLLIQRGVPQVAAHGVTAAPAAKNAPM